jgi:hypothetical protein
MEDYVLSNELLSEYQGYYNLKQDALGTLTKYFNNQMSDYEILSMKSDNDCLKIEINDLNYCLMAEEMVREKNLNIEIQDLKFPCTLCFQGIQHYTISQVGTNGELVEIPDYSLVSNAQILFDQLIYVDNDNIEIGFSIWKYMGGTGHNFLLLISAKTCQVLETQIELFDKLINSNMSEF